MTFETILFLESLIMSLCLKYLVQSFKWRVKLSVWEVVFFPVPKVIVFSFSVYYFLDKGFGLQLSFYLSFPDWIFRYTLTPFREWNYQS